MAQNSHLSTLSTGFSTCGNLKLIYISYKLSKIQCKKIPLAFYINLCVCERDFVTMLFLWPAKESFGKKQGATAQR